MDISTRMKSYENDDRLPKGTVIVRVDGKAFHTWTKRIGAKRPFDKIVSSCMRYATFKVAEQMQGFKLAYTQSDESTFLLSNLGEKEEAWFDYKVQKIASVTASLFTQFFNDEFELYTTCSKYPVIPAYFDARVFSIPVKDAANNFVWRQQDWNRNSVQMLGHHYMGHKRMQNLNTGQVRFLLKEEYGVDWFGLDGWEKFGTFFIQDSRSVLTYIAPMTYEEINRVTELDQYMEKE